MTDWQTLDTAPKNKIVWMFLPGSIWQSDENGRPVPGTVKNEIVLAEWSEPNKAWFAHDRPTRRLYASFWAEQGSEQPTEPQL